MASEVFVVALLAVIFVLFTSPSLGEDGNGYAVRRVARQTTDSNTQSEKWDEYCALPPPLDHGRFTPSPRRCPPSFSSASCHMIPGTLVPPQWVIFNSCNPGYKLHNGKTVSVCSKGKWVPSLPVCLGEGCRLPEMPTYGRYEAVTQCNPEEVGVDACRNVPGTLVPSNWIIKYICNHHYRPNTTLAISYCDNTKWINSVDCIADKCPPLISQSVDFECNKSGIPVSCERPMEVDTVATQRCKRGFGRTQQPFTSQISCLPSGEWSQPLFQCILNNF